MTSSVPRHRRLECLRLEREGHPDLVDPQAQRSGARLVDPQLVQGRHHVLPALARGHEREPVALGPAQHHPVDPVGPGKGAGRIELVDVQQPLDLERQRRPGLLRIGADAQSPPGGGT